MRDVKHLTGGAMIMGLIPGFALHFIFIAPLYPGGDGYQVECESHSGLCCGRLLKGTWLECSLLS